MRKMVRSLAYLIVLFLLEACSNIADAERGTYEPISIGDVEMVHFSRPDSAVELGSNATGVKASEKPAMQVVLKYGFSMGKHEVTCGEFLEIMPAEPYSSSVECESEALPVVNVNYYDAVLFANALSKKQGKDTAYVYTHAEFDADGCSSLMNLLFDPSVEAFRLPTEAEWVYAAKHGWNTADGWTAANSDFKLHDVCSLKENEAGICDMAGNAMEWVQDWLGSFRDTTVENFVGAVDGGNLGERVVKGGSFRLEESAVNYVSRGDVYTVTSGMRTPYVGFRIAYGSIPGASWLSGNGGSSANLFISLVDAVRVRDLTKTYKTKFAFRDDNSGNLAFIDYSVAGLRVNEIDDTLDVYHPDISPDGELVAFCTKPEGVSGKSELYVRHLDETGSGLVRLDVESAAIPRWRLLENGDTAIVYVTDAGNNKDETQFMSQSTWQVVFADGKFGKPKKLFDGAYHGGVSDDGLLAVTGARLLRARLGEPVRDTVWYNGEQACNASLSKDGSKRTAFLDFASATGRKFVGKEYGTHEYILVADSAGKLVGKVAAPSGYSFDHVEWVLGHTSGTGNLLVATLVNSAGVHERIALVNVADGSVTDILSGDEIWHPCVWVKSSNASLENTSLDPDSAGVYFIEGGEDVAAMLRYDMELIWKYRDSADFVALGSSRTQAGFNPKLITNHFAINIANVPNSLVETQYVFENYVMLHVKNLKYVMVSLDIDMWWKVADNSWTNFFYKEYRKYPGFAYDENHEFWIEGYPEGLLEMTENSVGITYYEERFRKNLGFNSTDCESWEGENPSVDYDSTWMDEGLGAMLDNINRTEVLIKTAQEHGITFIGVIFPQSPGFANTGAFGRYGLRHAEAETVIQQLRALEEKYPNFILLDENRMGQHDYPDSEAVNRDHLCRDGAARLTARIDSLLETLE